MQSLFKRFQSFITPESWEDFYGFLHQTESFADRQSTEIKLLLGNNEIAYTRVEGIAVQNSYRQTNQVLYRCYRYHREQKVTVKAPGNKRPPGDDAKCIIHRYLDDRFLRP